MQDIFSVTTGKAQYTHKVVNTTFWLQTDKTFQKDHPTIKKYLTDVSMCTLQTWLEVPKTGTKPLLAAKYMALKTKEKQPRKRSYKICGDLSTKFWKRMVVMVALHCKCTLFHRITQLKVNKAVNFTLCIFYN